MNLVILSPVSLGAVTVAQAGLNRQIADRRGLPSAVMLNTVVASLCAGALLASLLATQIVASVLWDRFVEHIPLSATRVIGAALALASVLLVGKR